MTCKVVVGEEWGQPVYVVKFRKWFVFWRTFDGYESREVAERVCEGLRKQKKQKNMETLDELIKNCPQLDPNGGLMFTRADVIWIARNWANLNKTTITLPAASPGKSITIKNNDSVNHPAHYTDGKIETIDFIEDKRLVYHLGNAVKYISRAGKKDPAKEIEDLKKAAWYLSRHIENLEKKQLQEKEVLMEKKRLNEESVSDELRGKLETAIDCLYHNNRFTGIISKEFLEWAADYYKLQVSDIIAAMSFSEKYMFSLNGKEGFTVVKK